MSTQDLEAEVVGIAGRFLQLPPRAVAIAKRIISRGYELPLRESQELEIDSQLELLHSADLCEALDSFFGEAPAQFQRRIAKRAGSIRQFQSIHLAPGPATLLRDLFRRLGATFPRPQRSLKRSAHPRR